MSKNIIDDKITRKSFRTSFIVVSVFILFLIFWILGTLFGFYYATHSQEVCRPIECPTQYQCQPGTVCQFTKCESCEGNRIILSTAKGG